MNRPYDSLQQCLFPGYMHALVTLVMWLLCNISIYTMKLINGNKLNNIQKASRKRTHDLLARINQLSNKYVRSAFSILLVCEFPIQLKVLLYG